MHLPVPQRRRLPQAPAGQPHPTRAWPCPRVFASIASRLTLGWPPDCRTCVPPTTNPGPNSRSTAPRGGQSGRTGIGGFKFHRPSVSILYPLFIMQSRSAASSSWARCSCESFWKAETDRRWCLHFKIRTGEIPFRVCVVDGLTAGRQDKEAPYNDGRRSHVGS